MSTEKLITIINEAKRFGTFNQSDLPLVIETLERFIKGTPAPKLYLLKEDSDYSLVESDHEEALTKKEMSGAIGEMIDSRNKEIKAANSSITALSQNITSTEKEIKQLCATLLSISDLEL